MGSPSGVNGHLPRTNFRIYNRDWQPGQFLYPGPAPRPPVDRPRRNPFPPIFVPIPPPGNHSQYTLDSRPMYQNRSSTMHLGAYRGRAAQPQVVPYAKASAINTEALEQEQKMTVSSMLSNMTAPPSLSHILTSTSPIVPNSRYPDHTPTKRHAS